MILTDAIILEKTNTRHIYLYYYRVGAWSCCGRSAELLHGLYPNIYYSGKSIPEWEKELPVAVIDAMTLRHLLEIIPPKEKNGERIVIEIPESWSLYL